MTQRTGRRAGRLTGTLALLVATGMVLAALLVVWLSAHKTNTSPSAASTPATTSTSPTSASSAAPSEAIETPLPGALTFEALLTPDELAAVGLTSDTPVGQDAPQFPVLCDAGTWGAAWSAPTEAVGHSYPVAGAGVTEYAFGYPDDASAAAALDRLASDASSCSTPASGSIEVTAPAVPLGDGAVGFRFDDGGRDGVLAVTQAVVARSADRLVLVTYTTQETIGTGNGPGDGGADDAGGDGAQAASTAVALAQAALAKV